MIETEQNVVCLVGLLRGGRIARFDRIVFEWLKRRDGRPVEASGFSMIGYRVPFQGELNHYVVGPWEQGALLVEFSEAKLYKSNEGNPMALLDLLDGSLRKPVLTKRFNKLGKKAHEELFGDRYDLFLRWKSDDWGKR